MREQYLQPRHRKRFVATTDSVHNLPVFPNLVQDMVPDGPNQLWTSDSTYVSVINRRIHAALVIDAWSLRIVGYAVSPSINTRLVAAALEAARGCCGRCGMRSGIPTVGWKLPPTAVGICAWT